MERLRDLDIPLTQEVRAIIAQTPEAQLERNVLALEEEAATKGLRSPIGAFKHFIKNNCQPRDERQSWSHGAAAALGKERRDQLIQVVTEYAGAIQVFFTNGRQITLSQVQCMTWEAMQSLPALAGSGLSNTHLKAVMKAVKLVFNERHHSE